MKENFHYQRHRVEALRARRRFTGLNVAFFAALAVIVGVHYAASHAATAPTTATLDGVKIDTSGTGTYGGNYSGLPFSAAKVTVAKSGYSSSTTAQPFYFNGGSGHSAAIPTTTSGVTFTINVSPSSYSTYAIKGTTWEDGTVSGWNPQTSGFAAGATRTVKLYAGHNYHMRFIFNKVTPTPTPTTPPPTPKSPTPVPKTPTPPGKTPGKTPVPNPGGGTAAPDTAPPSTPGSFVAAVSGGSSVIVLSWAAATDNVAVTSYHLERSTDQSVWSATADVPGVAYQDLSPAFGVHYYYRLSAFDAAGNQSGFATADTTTPAFNGNTTTGNSQKFTSDDSVASVTVPSGAFDSDTDCTVVTLTTSVAAGKSHVVAGPYQLVCKDSSGNQIVTTNQAFTWAYNLSGKLNGYTKPQGVVIDDSTQTVVKSTYSSKAHTLTFTAATLGVTAVLASKSAGFPVTIVVFALLLMGAVIAFVLFILRSKQKQSYDEYIRSKYYDI